MRISKQVYDEDLIMLIHQGNVKASEELISRYDSYSWKIALDFTYEHPRSGITNEEYHQVAFTSSIKAIKKYMPNNGRFYGFWKTIANNDLLKYFLENSYQAGANAFYGTSFDYIHSDDILMSESYGEMDYGIHNIIAKKELEVLIEEAKERFKEKNDRLIINLFLRGHTFEEIVEIRQTNYRHVTYVVSRFQKHLTKILKKCNYN